MGLGLDRVRQLPNWPRRPIVVDSLLAVTVVVVASVVIRLIDSISHVSNISNLYIIGIAVLAARRGVFPALLASILAFLTYDWFFIPPVHTFTVDNPSEYVALVTLLVTSIIIGQLLAAVRRLAGQGARARALEESDRLKSALVSSVSHELKTPLAAIKASATTLLQDSATTDFAVRRELTEAINREVDRLTRLVSDLLDMSRLEAGGIRPQPEWVSIVDVVADVLERLEPVLRDRDVAVNIPEDIPETPLDFVRISQVLMNLPEIAP